MSKSYKIKLNQGSGEAKLLDIPKVSGGSQPLVVKALPGGKYQLVDASTGYGPENIRASRMGKNLQVFFEGRGQPDLVIEDYYAEAPEGFNGLIGESESGRFYEYVPETAVGQSAVPLLADGSYQVGMALGGAEIDASGAAVGALVAVAGLNPLLLAPLAPLALLGAGGGGGGGGVSDNKSATVKINKALLDTGVNDSDFVTKGPVTEFSGTLSNFTGTPGDKVKLELLDKDGKPLDPVLEGTVTPTEINGVWTWKWTPVDQDATTNLPEVLKDGNYTVKATIVTSAGIAYTQATASATQAVDIDTTPNEGLNKDVVVSITRVSDDTGSLNNDWLTSDTSLIFNGTLNKFSANLGDVIMLVLDPVKEGQATIVQYVTPVLMGDVWGWTWDAQTTPFAEGAYKLTATLVDQAGNAFTQQGATAAKNLTLDTTGSTDSKGLAIVSLAIDSGVGSFSPLDASRKDFKTNDNTPIFKGTLTEALPPGEKVAVQMLKDNVVVASGVATVDSTEKAWTWTPLNPLPDAAYTLKAEVVDAAGNPALNGSATKSVVIDTQGLADGSDANSGLKTRAIGISTDTAANGSTNADLVTSDGTNKDGISNTDDDALMLTGQLNKPFTQNGGKVLVKITDLAGQLVSSAYVEPQTESANTWTYTHLGPLSEGQYVVKTTWVDHVGNMISAMDQAFLLDKTSASWTPSGLTNTGSPTVHTVNFNDYAFSVNEYGTYQFNGGSVQTYTGGKLVFDAAGKTYESGGFKLDFWDQAGNLTSITNTDQKWIFGTAATPLALGPNDPGYLGPQNFTGMKTLGSVGKLDISSNFDMASLYDGIDSVADQAVANHIALSHASHVALTLSMGDVLALGVTNSFSVADADHSRHKGQIQMLIDGQAGDTLHLDGWVNGLNLPWTGGQTSANAPLTLGVEQYNVYANVDLGLALFVDKDITVNVL